MPMQAFKTTLRILLFRAGPEDFPYSEKPGLTRACIAIAILANALLFGLSTPRLLALSAGAVTIGGVALFTRMTLRLRKLDNRYAQTLNALLACGSVLILLMRLPAAEMMPQMKAFVLQAQQNPDLADHPESWPALPAGAALLLDVLAIWFVAVTVHIFRRATATGFFAGGLIGLLCIFNVTLFLIFTTPLLALLFG